MSTHGFRTLAVCLVETFTLLFTQHCRSDHAEEVHVNPAPVNPSSLSFLSINGLLLNRRNLRTKLQSEKVIFSNVLNYFLLFLFMY